MSLLLKVAFVCATIVVLAYPALIALVVSVLLIACIAKVKSLKAPSRSQYPSE